MRVKKGDNVYILAGKDRGKTGKIVRAFPSEDKVLVEGINMKKVHRRAQKKEGKGEVVEKAYPIHVSNVKLSNEKAAAKKAKSK